MYSPALSAALKSNSYRPWLDIPPAPVNTSERNEFAKMVAEPDVVPPDEVRILYRSSAVPVPNPHVPFSFARADRNPPGMPTSEFDTVQNQHNDGSMVDWFQMDSVGMAVRPRLARVC